MNRAPRAPRGAGGWKNVHACVCIGLIGHGGECRCRVQWVLMQPAILYLYAYGGTHVSLL